MCFVAAVFSYSRDILRGVAREEERVGAAAQGPFCRDPVDPVDPLDPLAWKKVVFRLSKTMIFM